MSEVLPSTQQLAALKQDAMQIRELQKRIVDGCRKITGYENHHVTPIQVVEIVMKVLHEMYGLEPKQ